MLVQFALAGIAAGLCSGMFGVGGGMVLVPALLLLMPAAVPAEQQMLFAIGTSLAAIVFSCASSAFGHWLRGAVDFALWRRVAPALIAGALGGAMLTPHAPHLLLLALALLEAWLCIVVLRQTFSAADAAGTARAAGRAATPTLFVSIGALAAFAGVGIGTLAVSYLRRLDVPAHRAVGTAAALGVPAALAAAGGMAFAGEAQHVDVPFAMGYVHLVALAGIAPGVLIGAQIGALLAHRCLPKVLMAMFCLCSGAAAARSLLALAT